MNLLFTILAASIALLLSTSATSVQIRSAESWIYQDLCNNDTLSLRLSLSNIETGFIASPSVRCVDLSYNRIDSIDKGAFDRLPNLEYLNLQGNRIRPSNLFQFGNLTNIKKLILSHNENYYDYVQPIHVRGTYPQLQYLNLRNTRASAIDSDEENPFPEMKYLDFSQNQISRTNFINLNIAETLTYLSLAMNNIQQISLTKFSNLISLDLDSNSIREIGSSYHGLDLTGLIKLNYLSVANNGINFINRDAFRDNVNLLYLNISRNALSSLYEETLEDLKSLQVLILDHNNFDAVPIMRTPMNLTTLSMKYNNVTNLTNNSTNLPYLTSLFLSENNITNIFPQMFESYVALEELYLDGNQLTAIPQGWCDSMKMLRILDLSRNKFTVLESIFYSHVPSLQFVYFEDNPLEYIDTSTLKIIPKNVTIYFKHYVNKSIIQRSKTSFSFKGFI